jgi:hypothetical protein
LAQPVLADTRKAPQALLMRLRKSRSERTLAPFAPLHELGMAGRSHGLDRAEPMGRGFKSCPHQCEKPLITGGFFSFYVLLRRSKFQ